MSLLRKLFCCPDCGDFSWFGEQCWRCVIVEAYTEAKNGPCKF